MRKWPALHGPDMIAIRGAALFWGAGDGPGGEADGADSGGNGGDGVGSSAGPGGPGGASNTGPEGSGMGPSGPSGEGPGTTHGPVGPGTDTFEGTSLSNTESIGQDLGFFASLNNFLGKHINNQNIAKAFTPAIGVIAADLVGRINRDVFGVTDPEEMAAYQARHDETMRAHAEKGGPEDAPKRTNPAGYEGSGAEQEQERIRQQRSMMAWYRGLSGLDWADEA